MHMLSLFQSSMEAAQVGAATLASSATDSVGATLGLGVVVSVLLQAVKNSNWFPWITRRTSQINFWVGVVAAAATTLGIHASYDAATGGTVTLPSLHVLWQGVVQWSTQQAAYKGLVVPAEVLGEIRTLIERFATPPPVSEGAAKAAEGTVKP